MNIENLEIRVAVSADIARLSAIDHTCNSQYVWQLDLDKDQTRNDINISLREVRLPRAIQVQYPRDHFSLADVWKTNAITLVAVTEGVPVGYIRFLAQPTAESVWILDLVVETVARRKQVASLLIQQVEDWATERKNRQLFIEMSSKNHPAISLAKKMGFAFSGYNDHYYATQDVALFFGKLLKQF